MSANDLQILTVSQNKT